MWMVYYFAHHVLLINEIWNASSGLPQILAHITNIHIHQQDSLTGKIPTSYHKIDLSDIWWWWMNEDDRYDDDGWLMMIRYDDEWWWSYDDGLPMMINKCHESILIKCGK